MGFFSLVWKKPPAFLLIVGKRGARGEESRKETGGQRGVGAIIS